jgi:hypothetical protein
MGGTLAGERWVTSDSSARGSSVWPDRRRIRSDMGFRSVSLDLDLAGAAVGVDVPLALPDSFSLMPLMSDVCDLEKAG